MQLDTGDHRRRVRPAPAQSQAGHREPGRQRVRAGTVRPPLIKGLRKPNRLPSYLNAEIFGAALIRSWPRTKPASTHAFELTATELRETIAKIDPHNPTRGLLLSLVDQAEPRVGELKQRVAEWFDTGMDRVAGWYKRQVKYFLLAVAAVVTVAVNADTLRIAEQRWRDDALRTAIAAAAEKRQQRESSAGSTSERSSLRSRSAIPIPFPASPCA